MKKLVVTILLAALIFVIPSVYAQENEFKADLMVLFTTDEGWTVLAQPNGQVKTVFNIIIYVNKPAIMDLKVKVGDQIIFQTKEDVEFRYTHQVNIKEGGKSLLITADFETTAGKYHVEFQGVVVKTPVPVPRDLSGWISPKQLSRILENVTWTTIMISMMFGLMGIGAAILSKYYFMLLEPFNAIYLTLIGAIFSLSIFMSPDYGLGYGIIAILAGFLSYHYLRGPRLIGIIAVDEDNRNVWDVNLPIYFTEDGPAVALQSTVWALRRILFNQHAMLENNSTIATLWKRNQETDLILANDADIQRLEKAVETEKEGVKKVKGRWVMRVDSMDVHEFNDLEFMKAKDSFKKLNKAYEELKAKLVEMESTFNARVLEEAHKISKRFLDRLWAAIEPGVKEEKRLDILPGGEKK
jgi:hypothetical protein